MRPFFKITDNTGGSWCTEMAEGITLAEATAYFVGQRFDMGVFPIEKMVTAVNVEQLGVVV